MPKPKKGERIGGRAKGTPNKVTSNAREAIARFVDGNAPRLQSWLDQIATNDGPAAAFKCFSDLLEYHVPKLSRTELSGDAKNPVKLEIGWKGPE